MENAGFHRFRDPNVLLTSDPCVTTVGAPRALARNYDGYSAIGRHRQFRWSAWEREDTAFDAASAFLQERDDICLPVEFLSDLIQEDSKLNKSSRCLDQPDHLCGDLSWPGPCLENLTTGVDAIRPSTDLPLLVHTVGANNADIALLRPRECWLSKRSNGGSNSRGTDLSSADDGDESRDDGELGNDIEVDESGERRAGGPGGHASRARVDNDNQAAVAKGERLAIDSGRIRQISAAMPVPNQPPKILVRCDYSVTLVELRGDLELLRSGAKGVEESRPAEDCFGDSYPGILGGFRVNRDGLIAVEKLVFARRLACSACSPFTRANAAFLDEDFRLFVWHPNRGAVMHGAGPLHFSASVHNINDGESGGVQSAARARRTRNADVSLDYGHHPRVLWMAAQHNAYRVDLRERASSTSLAPALDLGVYFEFQSTASISRGGSGGFGGRGERPKIRALAVGRRSVHEVFVAAGLHLACMDDRFPRDAVARWDLPHEVDQLKWLPGLPGEGVDAEEMILASGRSSPRYYVNTWAKDVPNWRGFQTRLGLDETSPAASAARRPLTFSVPASTLAVGETRSGALIAPLPPVDGKEHEGNDGLCFIYATSAGDVYGQRLEIRRTGGENGGKSTDGPATAALAQHSCILSDRIQSMLPCGNLCLDPCATLSPPVTENGEKQKDGMACSSAGAANDGSRGARPASGNRDDSDEEDISEKGSDSLEDDQESDDHDGRFGRLTGAAGKKRPRQELERHSAPSAPPTHVKREYSNSTADGAGTSTPARSEPEYFPLSAGALRASLEVVPAKEMSSWRRLPPLLKLVTERQAESRAKKAEVTGATADAGEQRKLGLARLHERKRDLEKFLLQPKTPTELLKFCRNTLGILLPGDSPGAPVSRQGVGGAVPNAPTAGGFSPHDGVDDTAAAAEVAEIVLRWGQPFRKIKTNWRAAPAPGAFVANSSSLGSSSSRATVARGEVDTVVLSSAQVVLKSQPSPLLAPGTFGTSFASDFTVQDVRWLKDQWKC